jgi:RNA polymerase sigma-70 factor (ECF subfamily)
LGDVEIARDTVQQLYYKIWENRMVLNISISIKAYLFKSLYHACLNTLQHQKNIQKYEECQLADLYFSTIIQTPEAEMFLWQSDIKQALQEAIATLPEKCREVFLLSKMEGLKNREIAAKLNISEKTVERHMSLALSKLRKELDWILQYILFYSIFN